MKPGKYGKTMTNRWRSGDAGRKVGISFATQAVTSDRLGRPITSYSQV